MKVKEFYDFLDSISPFSSQASWDNSGLLIGSMEDEFEHIALALELDLAILSSLKPHTLLITHHPLIFHPLKSLDSAFYPACFIPLLHQKHCSLIAMHTNFDSTHLNPCFAKEILGLKSLIHQGEVLISELPAPTDTLTLAKSIKEKMQLDWIKISDAAVEIRRVGVVCGAGFSLFRTLQNHQNLCFITGDVKYHEAMESIALGVSVIDVGHYESERHFPQILQRILQKEGYKAIIINSKNPFQIL